MREVSLCARDKHEGCDAVGEVARARCGVRARAEGCVRRYYFFPTLNGIHLWPSNLRTIANSHGNLSASRIIQDPASRSSSGSRFAHHFASLSPLQVKAYVHRPQLDIYRRHRARARQRIRSGCLRMAKRCPREIKYVSRLDRPYSLHLTRF